MWIRNIYFFIIEINLIVIIFIQILLYLFSLYNYNKRVLIKKFKFVNIRVDYSKI